MSGPYIDLQEHRIRRKFVEELKQIEEKLNLKIYQVEYLIKELDVDDIVDEKDFICEAEELINN